MSSLVQAELVATCNSLGCLDGETYYKEPECLESIKDLIRFLKRDDNNHEIRRQLGEICVLQTDLIHILKTSTSKDDSELFSVLIRLLVNFTMPTLVIFENAVPDEKISRKYYMEIIGYLQEYKKAFCDEAIWVVLSDKLREFLNLDWENRQEDEKLVLEWILILIRNILHIPANPNEEMRTDDDASIHDRALWAFHKSGIEDLLLFIANSDDYQEFCLHTLEIVTLMLREQNPQQLATAGACRSQSEKQRDEQELLEIRKRETESKLINMKQYHGTRHTRFGGTYCVKDVKSISDRELIVHRPVNDITKLDFDKDKTRRKKPKNRRPMQDMECTRRSTLSIRLFLKDFCVEFLNNAYNSIMYIVKDQLARQRTQDHDETYYLWAIKFFMEFNRLHEFRVELVSETMSVSAFHYIQTQLENYQEMMITEKNKIPLWSKRMHLALKAYQELIMTLTAMDSSTDEKICDGAKVIKTNLFYMLEYRELAYILLHHFDEVKMSKSYLKDLVEMTHVFLKLLEKHCKRCTHLIVEKAKGRKQSNAKQKGKATKAKSKSLNEEQLDEVWNAMSTDLSSAIQGQLDLPMDIIPFDAASDTPIDDQRGDAMRRIQGFLRATRPLKALALFRAAREVWPEENYFGAPAMELEDEFMALREVLFADLPGGPITAENSDGDMLGTENEFGQTLEPPGVESEDEEMAEVNAASNKAEREFDFKAFVVRFASAKVINAYALLLHQHETNSTFTNHCIIKMFHRFAFDCKMPALIFQASIFRDFQKILGDPKLQSAQSLKEVVKFIKFILVKFFEVAQRNNKVLVELLFWKGERDAHDIEIGYGSYKDQAKKGAQYVWTEEQEEELKELYNEFNSKLEPGQDIVELIMEEFSDRKRTKMQIIRQLKRQNLVLDAKSLKRSGSKRVEDKIPKEFTDEEIDELRSLFQQFKDADDIVGRILDNLTIKRPKKRVVQKMLDLGIVNDKKELRKKARRRAGKSDDGNVKSRGKKYSDDAAGSSSRQGTSHTPRPNATTAVQKRRMKHTYDSSSESSSASDDEDVHDNEGLIQILRTIAEMDDLKGSISWVKDDLKDIGDDRANEDDIEAAPLVPILEETHLALNNPHFTKLLKNLGLMPPTDEQEIYWRYPVTLTARLCHERAQLLEDALQGKLNPAPQDINSSDECGTSDEDIPLTNVAPDQLSTQNSAIVSEEIGEQMPNASSTPFTTAKANLSSSQSNKPKRKKIIISSDSDEDIPLTNVAPDRLSTQNSAIVSEEIGEQITNASSTPFTTAKVNLSSYQSNKPKRKKIIISSDSEDDMPLEEAPFAGVSFNPGTESTMDNPGEQGSDLHTDGPEENIGKTNKRKARDVVNDDSDGSQREGTGRNQSQRKRVRKTFVIESDSE